MTPPHAFYSCDSSANPTTSKASPPPYFYGIPVGFSPPPYAPHSTFRPPQLPNGEAATTPTQGYAPAVEATADFSGHDHKTTNQPYAGDHSCVTHLNFFDNHVRKLEGLSKWPALLRLTVKWNDLKSFQGLQEASYLRWIDASGNLLTSMKGAGTLPSMEWLDLHFNNLATLSGLVSAPNLTWLSLNSNHLEHLSGVEAMPNLRFLDVSNNDLKSISGVERCQQLQEINLATNFLGTSATEQVKCLAELPHLFRINVHNNDFTPSEVERIATHFKGWKNQCEVIVDEEGCRQVGHLFDVPPDIPKDWKPPKKCILL
eukprot:GGOE01043794.1.p1 GENE.GGOE01043794.1~~GGOE01043794.1.p1  ORF type:complete len:368 (+),score=102.62 GGOE01043794.1:158-1105(+)